jgi:hypothetical protein
MSFEIIREGGPLNPRRTGPEQFELSISLLKDADGRTARECPNSDCSPGYFKVTGGTGVKGPQTVMYCPYCQKAAEPSDLHTKEQIRYCKELLMMGIERSSGKRRLVGGFINIDLEIKPSRLRHV